MVQKGEGQRKVRGTDNINYFPYKCQGMATILILIIIQRATIPAQKLECFYPVTHSFNSTL